MQFKKTAKVIIFSQLFLAVFLFAQNVHAEEKITNFESVIKIEKTGRIDVTEKITYDFGTENKHGIFRYIPIKSRYKIENSPKYLNIQINSVIDEKNIPYPYIVTEENFVQNVKIGDPDKTITGIHQYVINYQVSGAIGSYKDFDEIYWNVTGNGWKVPIEKSSTIVILPEGSNPILGKVFCYKGQEGQNIACNLVTEENGSTKFTQTQVLQPGEGYTIAVGFQKGIVPNYVYNPKWYEKESNYYFVSLCILILGLLFLLYKIFFVYLPEIHKRTKPIITNYEPSLGMTPSEAGHIYNTRSSQDSRSLSGDIVYLATEGYITIENQSDESEFSFGEAFLRVIIKNIVLIVFMTLILLYLYDLYITIQYIVIPLALLTVVSNLYKDFVKIKNDAKNSSLSFSRTDKGLSNQKEHIKYLYYLITDQKKPKTVKQIGIEAPYDFFQKYTSLYKGKDVSTVALLSSSPKAFTFLILVLFGILFSIFTTLFVSGFTGLSISVILLPFVTIGVLLVLGVGVIKPAYKRSLRKTTDEYYNVAGLYRYIKIAEKDRLASEYKPEEISKLFSKLLPFAITFGLGDKWVKSFDGLIVANPDWYRNTSSDFSSTAFTSSLAGISSSMSAVSSSGTSASSVGGFDGGSGGGGSSGGGGGGGGGGSW